jgi:S-adenosyl methyltransferase
MNEVPRVPAGVDTGRPAPARIYDYMLQGNNYFQVDRFAAEQILKAAPEIRDAAWSNRGFRQRAAKFIGQQGVRQFVDIGSGLPTVGNTHEVVQKVRFFAGLELVPPFEGAEPAVTFTGLRGAEDADLADSDGSRWLYCGVARKP